MKQDLQALDFNLLKALNALLEQRSVTRAAEQLSLSQPAVSLMLTKLREYFGDPLFVRGQRGMIPTNRALELALPVSQILSNIALLSQPAEFDTDTANMDITIAATDYALKAVVLPFMSVLKKRSPGIRLAVIPVDAERMSGQFERGDIDLALIRHDAAPAELHFRTLYQERYVCMLRADHPAAAKNALTLKDFCEPEHVIVSSTGHFRDDIDQRLAEKGCTRRIGMAVNSYVVLPEVLRTTDMIAVVPYRLTCAYDFLARFELPLEVPGFNLTMAWHERSHRDVAHQWIRSLLFEVGQRPNILSQTSEPYLVSGL